MEVETLGRILSKYNWNAANLQGAEDHGHSPTAGPASPKPGYRDHRQRPRGFGWLDAFVELIVARGGATFSGEKTRGVWSATGRDPRAFYKWLERPRGLPQLPRSRGWPTTPAGCNRPKQAGPPASISPGPRGSR